VILKANDIYKTFEGIPPIDVLRGISLELAKEQTLAIMGKSGEGKSTLLHILGTLDRPTKGKIKICGKDPSSYPVSLLRREHIGFIFQSYYLLEDFTVLENVLMPLRIGRKLTKATLGHAKELIHEVGLTERQNALAKTLSGGEKQRVAIARALVHNPELILADEPTGNLDAEHSSEIQQLLLSSANKFQKALIVVTHDNEFAKQCDRLLFLKEGQLYTQ
jgi:lipoprotein-releasing system ATP-binding protein